MKMKDLLIQAFSDDKDNISSIRILTAFIVLDIMLVWTILCIKKGEFIPIGWDNSALIFSAMGAKVWQKQEAENREVCDEKV